MEHCGGGKAVKQLNLVDKGRNAGEDELEMQLGLISCKLVCAFNA